MRGVEAKNATARSDCKSELFDSGALKVNGGGIMHLALKYTATIAKMSRKHHKAYSRNFKRDTT